MDNSIEIDGETLLATRKSYTWSYFLFSESKKRFFCIVCHKLGQTKSFDASSSITNLNGHITKHEQRNEIEKKVECKKKQTTLDEMVCLFSQ